MTDAQAREASRQFIKKWKGKGNEDEDARSYWIDIYEKILGGSSATDHMQFEKKVKIDGHTKKIDVYVPDTHVLIEQKSLGIPLDKQGHQSDNIKLTPYEQAKRYNDNLPYGDFIVLPRHSGERRNIFHLDMLRRAVFREIAFQFYLKQTCIISACSVPMSIWHG